jgi:hypothetical protein
MKNVNLQLRKMLVLLAFLLPGFVFAVCLAAPRTAAAAGSPFRHELAPTLSAAKQGPPDDMRLIVVTTALPACKAADGSGGCWGRDTLSSDNLTWDSMTTVGSGSSPENRPPD